MAITQKDLASPKDVIAYFVSKLNNWINVAGVDDLGNNQWKILTCNTKWAQKGFTIPDVGKIIDVDFNNYITVESETEILIENFELYPIKFVHGTAIQVNIENFTGENSLDPKLRLPVVYLREFTEMTRQSKWSNNLIRIEIPLTLYFLTKGNHDEWKTSDAYNEAIYPMKNLVDEFQKVLYKEKGNVGNWTEDTLNFHPKFGVRYVKKQNTDSKGVEVNYFDDNLTGVECNINLPLKIDFCKSCKDGEPPLPKFTLFVNEEEFETFEGGSGNLKVVNKNLGAVGEKENSNFVVRNLFVRRHDYQEPYSYCGVANDGTQENSTGWKITRIEILADASVIVMEATGKWTDRYILNYE
jgi:hypothetical protein